MGIPPAPSRRFFFPSLLRLIRSGGVRSTECSDYNDDDDDYDYKAKRFAGGFNCEGLEGKLIWVRRPANLKLRLAGTRASVM